MKPPLRAVGPSDTPPEPDTLAEALEAYIKKVIAAQPRTVMIVFEIGDEEEMPVVKTWPDTPAVRRGMTAIAFDFVRPVEVQDEE